jgi:hypothetical protein
MSPHWSKIRFKVTWIFWTPIQAIRWLHGFMPSWPLAARRSPGGAPGSSTHRRRIGLTFAGIRAVRMWPTRTVDWPISPWLLSRHRLSPQSLTTCRRRWKKKWCISAGLCLLSMTQTTDSFRRHHLRCFSCRRRRRNSWSWRRHHRHSGFSSCRFPSSCRCPSITILLSMSHRRRRISFTTIFTTRSLSTTRAIRSPSQTRAVRRRRSRRFRP